MAGFLQSEKWMSWAGVIGETFNDAFIGKYLRARLGFIVRVALGINDVGARLWCWWLPQAGSLGSWPLPLYFIFGQKFHLSPEAKLLMEAALLCKAASWCQAGMKPLSSPSAALSVEICHPGLWVMVCFPAPRPGSSFRTSVMFLSSWSCEAQN